MIEQIVQLVSTHYNLTVTTEPLPGETDRNVRLTTATGKFILKISPPITTGIRARIELEAAVMKHLASKKLPFQTPQIISTNTGELSGIITDSHQQSRYLRLQTWVAGEVLDSANPRTDRLLTEWGVLRGG